MTKILFFVLCNVVVFSTCSKEVSFAVYNVENLFDIRHDKGKNDWAFTPRGTTGKEENCKRMRNAYFRRRCLRTDWNQEALTAKIKALKTSLSHGPYGIPDILVLNEVENESVFKEFNKLLGYDSFFITQSPGGRGIDNVAAFKSSLGFEVQEVKEIIVKRFSTRNILKVRLKYGIKEFLIYVHHWPSQFNPVKARSWAAEAFARDLKNEFQRNPSLFVISAGDFNVLETEKPNSLKLIIEGELGLRDLHRFSQSPFPGTYFYKRAKRWNRFDRIYVSKNLTDKKGIDYVKDSYKVGNHTKNSELYLLKGQGRVSTINVPERFRVQGRRFHGASDHYPVFMKLTLPNKTDEQKERTTRQIKNNMSFFCKVIKYLTNLVL